MQQRLRLFPAITISALRGSSSSSSTYSHRLSSLGIVLLEKMNNRGTKSSSSASASNSPNQRRYVRVDRHVTNGSPTLGQTSTSRETAHRAVEQQTQLFSGSNLAYEAEWPLPSDNLGSGSKAKRKTGIDWGPRFETTSHQGAGKQFYLPKLEASFGSNSAKPYRLNVSAMHTRTLKKTSSFPSGSTYLPPNSPEPGVGVRSSGDSERMNVNEPFDICFSGSRRPANYKPYLEKDSLQGIEMDYPLENGEVLRPGMVLLRSYIPLSQQIDIVMRCRELGVGSGGFYQPGYHDGAKLRLRMMCLGLDWDPQTKKYGKMRDYDNAEPPDIPSSFDFLVRRALHDSQILIKQQLKRSDVKEILPGMSPDICIVNFYTTNGRLGLHQDRDESRESLLKGLPVVSFSIGDSAEFSYGDQRDVDKAERIILESGDVLIFGGKSRHIFHGVTSIKPKTAPPTLLDHTKLRPGRLNLTFRKN